MSRHSPLTSFAAFEGFASFAPDDDGTATTRSMSFGASDETIRYADAW